jgi:peptidoglycan hydrolase-like protein with peptidoglycan-binding domain
MAAAVGLVALVAGGVAFGVTSGADDDLAAPATTTTTDGRRPASTTTSSSTTTTSSTTSTTSPSASPAGAVLSRGDSGPEVVALQRRLGELRYDPGPVDGKFGGATVYAVQAFQKLNGMAPDGRVGPAVQGALANPAPILPIAPYGGDDRVEVALGRQVLVVYEDGEPKLITHVSTGSHRTYCARGTCDNVAITPVGSFRFAWRYKGWRESELGKLYNPAYFTSRGVAVHGSLSVPTYPASHGCVRIPMHIAEYFPSLVQRGDPIYVSDGRRLGPAGPTLTGPPPDDPPTTPGDDTSTTTTTTPSSTSTTTPTTTSSTTTTTTPTTSTTSTTAPPLP